MNFIKRWRYVRSVVESYQLSRFGLNNGVMIRGHISSYTKNMPTQNYVNKDELSCSLTIIWFTLTSIETVIWMRSDVV